jgi:hypothetical protein
MEKLGVVRQADSLKRNSTLSKNKKKSTIEELG